MKINNTLLCPPPLVNWCQRWFEFFPYPPISVLGLVENMLAHHCPELLKHYMKLGVTAHVYGWPLLETAFSEVTPRRRLYIGLTVPSIGLILGHAGNFVPP